MSQRKASLARDYIISRDPETMGGTPVFRSNKIEHLLSLVPALIATLEKIDVAGYAPGDLYEVVSK